MPRKPRPLWIHEGNPSHLPMITYRGTMADVRRARREGGPVRFTPINPKE